MDPEKLKVIEEARVYWQNEIDRTRKALNRAGAEIRKRAEHAETRVLGKKNKIRIRLPKA